jgi:hypothetical protein
VFGFKFAEFQVDGYQTPQFPVVEQQINEIIGIVNRDAFLAAHKSKIIAHFTYKILQIA